ncbi:pilus assembly protein TadG-related protein [Ornithinimicrobium panacihumi]|uniref:pilus assembly protein TadG-related protein n=1 Tax=Ornithinimicrobium panacihumi TaxID=2008449 RepID=UPI003F89A947
MSSGSEARGGSAHGGSDQGQISVLLVGLVAIVLTLVLGVVGVTSVQLSRIHLLDAADAAALAASDALAEEQVYDHGLGDGIVIDDHLVAESAAEHLASRTMPSRLTSWRLGPCTGTPDGRTAVVEVVGSAKIPLISSVLRAFGDGVTITVVSRARSDLEP